MATLNIEGQSVTIDDAFLSLSPEEQSRTVEEIAGQIGIAPAEGTVVPADERAGSGTALNVTAGVNEGLYGTLGAPVDLMRGAMNLGIRGANAVTGAEIGQIPDDSFGGSRWIGETLGAVSPALDPQKTVAATENDRIARGVGQGVGYTVAPAGVVGALGRGGQMSGKALDTATKLTGSTASAGSVAANAGVGGVAGGSAVAAMESAPDEWKPVAGMAGGLVGGGLAAMTGTLPGLTREGVRAARNLAAPLSASGRERLAGTRLQDAARDPAALRAMLDEGTPDLVPGSKPTTFQATGDMGIGELERGAATKYPGLFGERRAAQNAARVDAVSGIQKAGAPEQVAAAVRARLAEIDDATQSIVNRATEAARTRTGAIGQGRGPEDAGATLRGSLEAARAEAKRAERELWAAVDPDGTLALPTINAKQQASQIRKELPRLAKQPEGEEASILDALAGADDVVPLRDLAAVQSRLKEAMRAERSASGETQSFRRMAQLNSAIERDLTDGIATKATQQASAVQAGQLALGDTIAGRIQGGDVKTGNAVYTPAGQRVDVEFAVVDAGSLVDSSMPNYPGQLQPRDRSRAASELQIQRMANELQPERLGTSSSASDGAPIIGPDGVIESGNGRVQAIRRAYQQNGQSAAEYRRYLESQGFDTQGVQNPVLVRVRKTPLDDSQRVRFTREANASSTLGMSAGEQAALDAERMTDDLLALYQGGDLNAASNRDFSRAFLKAVPEQGQEAGFVTADGTLSLDGIQRMRSALLHSAYEDPQLVSALVETGDENIRAFGRALADISGDVARVRSGIKAGRIDPTADISAPLVEAGMVVQQARRRGIRIADAVAQQDAFSQVSPEALEVLKAAYGDDLAGRLSRERFDATMRVALSDAEKQTTDARLFGDSASISEILQGASARYGRGTQSAAQSGPLGDTGPSLHESGAGVGRSGAATAGTPDLARGGGTRILARPELAPNFDQTALGRLKAARAATRERAGTFDNRQLGPLRRRPSSTAPYDMPASAVPGRVFMPGPKGFETIQTYRKAVGDEEAFTALRDYAIDRLRKTALRDDGTLDPAKVTSWRRTHSDALRAFPDLDAKFADAAAASDTMARVAGQRKAVLDRVQRSVLGKFVGVDHPDDVTGAVGRIFGAQDSVNRMGQLRTAIRGNPDALAGLRKAVVDHVTAKFVGNTEAGTSGVGTIKSDGFQTFVRQNKATLRTAGFSDDELSLMGRIADDLQRANRSVASVKNPGGSNTAQDLMQVQKEDSGKTVLAKVIASLGAPGAGAGAGFAVGGGLGMAAGAVGAGVVAELRRQGLEKIDDLIADALLNPGRARLLLLKATSPAQEESLMKTLARLYHQSAVPTVATSAESMRQGEARP